MAVISVAAARRGLAVGEGMRGTLLTVGIGEAVVQLGLTPITAAIPGLAAALGVDAVDSFWVLTVFILGLAGTLLVSGRLGDLLGHRRVFGLGALVYGAAALAAGLAPTFQIVVAARALQGVGAAMISGNNLAILSRTVPTEHRGKAIGLVATASSLAGLTGAVGGPFLLEWGGWPTVVLATVPLAAWAALRARDLPETAPDAERVPVDWAGAGLLVSAITVLAVALNHPHTSASETVMPVFHLWLPALAGLAIGAFVAVERRVRVPLLDWTMLRNRVFAAAVGVNAILHFVMMASMFLGPIFVVRGLGLSVAAGAMMMIAVQATGLLSAMVGGWLQDRTRSPWLRPGAAGIMTIGLVLWGIAGLSGSFVALVAVAAFMGFGTGCLLAVNNTVIMDALPPAHRGAASGMLETTRHFGHAFGVTLPTAVLGIVAAGLVAPGATGEAAALGAGFFWMSLGLAGIGCGAVVLSTIRPRYV